MSTVSDFRLAAAMLLILTGLDAQAAAVPHAKPAAFATPGGELQEMSDTALREEVAQAGSLILLDRIGPNELTGAATAGTYANFTFQRMGLDGKLDFNANISKLQLGCGGVNNLLAGPGCDLDIDYLGFMGLNAAKDRPGAAGSAFEMTRPFFEMAFKNENNPATREFVGLRVGAQSINGALRMGRDYTGFGGPGVEPSLTNLENGGTCNPSATTGAGVVNCHSGINSLSGYLSGIELSAGIDARAYVCLTVCLFNIGVFAAPLDACLGRINYGPCTDSDRPFFVDAGGTRIQTLDVAAANLKIRSPFTLGLALTGYGRLALNLRQVHYLLAPDSPDFFLSFQREPVSWPRYSKTPPPSNIAYDSCNPAYNQVASRCSSAYLPAANTGWWLSAANTKVLNLTPPDVITVNTPGTHYGPLSLLAALGPNNSPIFIDNPKLGLVAADNCHGSGIFC
ncbi:MAG: hypothetical protein K0Q68_661 [Moraxellaceae bacterium]|jgi:hypothetical protein|nr:hypothetical protein [Moraxellaceae bacterium]